MQCISAQHTIIVAKNGLGVNHFLQQFWFSLPKLLGQFFAGLLDGMHAFVEHTSQPGEAHSGNHQTKNSTKDKIFHFESLLGSTHLPIDWMSLPAPCNTPEAVWQALSARATEIAINAFITAPLHS
jgi:hypothetical protein